MIGGAGLGLGLSEIYGLLRWGIDRDLMVYHSPLTRAMIPVTIIQAFAYELFRCSYALFGVITSHTFPFFRNGHAAVPGLWTSYSVDC